MTPNHEDSIKQEALATSYDDTAEAWRVRTGHTHQSLKIDLF